MGADNSTSAARYVNDFELIIRASKDLEHMFETTFGLPDIKDSGLHDKISAARVNDQPLPPDLVRRLRKIVTIRNKLVHDHDFNAIPDRATFIKEYDDAMAELRRLANVREPAVSACCMM
ncbi:hypothetical protein KFE25_013028 [Diacronema lutheri]|uniref:DUF4145 domain-containing protein n=1 Tax=Diacronema lutheri TaxID=2081491 RepID=A0A8J5XEN6_DIALT|nr:hypothetical protein KFE25_013028 [Diacronema lutheri]